MRIRFRNNITALAPALALAFTLAACADENESVNAGGDDLPESELAEQPDDVTDDDIERAVPGVEEAYPDGDTPNTADIEDSDDADYTEPNDPPE